MFWHGLNPFGALQLNEAGPAWAASGFRVVAPVAPGLGETAAFRDLETYRPTRLADLVARLATRLGFVRFDYVGWSWGASIGVHLAARHATRLTALVLLDAGHTDAQDAPWWTETSLDARIAEHRANARSFASWGEVEALARERSPSPSPALDARIRAGLEERNGRIVARDDPAATAAALHWLGVEPPSRELAAVGATGIPTLLVIAAQNDTSAQADRFLATVPEATVVAIDSGHDLLAQAPDETIALVADWLLARR